MKWPLILLLLAALQLHGPAGLRANHEAAGIVEWGRDLNGALTLAGQTGKPVFALFQEIPGCAGCRQFGREVLSHPLIAEAIQSEFTPLLIHNNSGGGDSEVLKRFGEPAWNYQVVRFLNGTGKDLIPRRDRVWETGPLAQRMIDAMGQAARPVPRYLKMLAVEHSPSLKKAAFAMDCFWTGEMKLGQIAGVITTEAGFIGRQEVTLIQYDPALISLTGLMAAAAKVECARAIFVGESELVEARTSRLSAGIFSGHRKAPLRDQKKQLSHIDVTALQLTLAQATTLNSWLREDPVKALSCLSPMQRGHFK